MEKNQKQVAIDLSKMLLSDIWGLYLQIKQNSVTIEDRVVMSSLIQQIKEASGVLTKVDVDKDKSSSITFGDLERYYEKARTNYIIVHRVNYLAMDAIIAVQDLVEDRYRFTIKKEGERSIGCYNDYINVIKKNTDFSAYCVLQDHLRLTKDALQLRLENIFMAIRDRMIYLRMRDVEVKARIELAYLLLRVAKHSRKHFFLDFEEQTGIDFTRAFKYADLKKMEEHFVGMVRHLGYKTTKNDKGDFDVEGFDASTSVRVQGAWNAFIKDLRDEDLMDETAKSAINLNPLVSEAYKKELEMAEKKEMQDSVSKLQEKFKVTKK